MVAPAGRAVEWVGMEVAGMGGVEKEAVEKEMALKEAD